jgi:hypothetical protein
VWVNVKLALSSAFEHYLGEQVLSQRNARGQLYGLISTYRQAKPELQKYFPFRTIFHYTSFLTCFSGADLPGSMSGAAGASLLLYRRALPFF